MKKNLLITSLAGLMTITLASCSFGDVSSALSELTENSTVEPVSESSSSEETKASESSTISEDTSSSASAAYKIVYDPFEMDYDAENAVFTINSFTVDASLGDFAVDKESFDNTVASFITNLSAEVYLDYSETEFIEEIFSTEENGKVISSETTESQETNTEKTALKIKNGKIYGYSLENTDDPEYYYADVSSYATTLKPMLNAMLEKANTDLTVDAIYDFLFETVLPDVNELAAKVAETINTNYDFDFSLFEAAESAESAYTLNLDALYTLNDDLNTLPIADVVDKYLGEGTFDKIAAVINSKTLNTLTIGNVKTALETELGITLEDVEALVNECLAFYDEDMTVDSLISMATEGQVTSLDTLIASYKDMTVLELISEATDTPVIGLQFYLTTVDAFMATARTVTLYSYIESLMVNTDVTPDISGIISGDFSSLINQEIHVTDAHSEVKAYLDVIKNSVDFSYDTNEEGIPTSVKASVKGLSLDSNMQLANIEVEDDEFDFDALTAQVDGYVAKYAALTADDIISAFLADYADEEAAVSEDKTTGTFKDGIEYENPETEEVVSSYEMNTVNFASPISDFFCSFYTSGDSAYVMVKYSATFTNYALEEGEFVVVETNSGNIGFSVELKDSEEDN